MPGWSWCPPDAAEDRALEAIEALAADAAGEPRGRGET
jgi:hypothetical protein